jgi:hypothetical protein
MKMYDAGESFGKTEMAIESPGNSKDKKYYPHLDMDSNQFPDISKLKVGQKCMLMIEVKPTRYSINEKEGDKNPKSSMCFEVLRVGMADEQNESSEKKVDKMMEKMYPEKK